MVAAEELKFTTTSKRITWFAIGVGVFCIALVCVVIAFAVQLNEANGNENKGTESKLDDKNKEPTIQTCETSSQTGTINLQDPDQPSVFHDLTKKEIQGLMEFLYANKALNLTKPDDITVMSTYKYLAELYLPNKSSVLEFLDNDGPQPPREARVTIFFGDKPTPYVSEFIVGPLPKPTYMHYVPGRPSSVPFIYRPLSVVEDDLMIETATDAISLYLTEFLMDIYGGKLKNCGNRCLKFYYFNQVSSAVTLEQTRKYWIWLSRCIDYYLLNPLDFAVLMKVDSEPFAIERIWFNGTTYEGIQPLKDSYINKTFDNLKYQNLWPQPNQMYFSEAKRRGLPFANKPLRGPTFVEPEGKRYSIQHRHVTYLPWSFHFRLSSEHGPQLYDIRYRGHRIVYELGLQELCVFYSGYSIFQKYTDFFDSTDLLGPSVSPLVPGVDCPKHATFIDSIQSTEAEEPETFTNAWCLFELNTGEPLRRHHKTWPYNEAFYEGVENVVLVLRTILTIANYDYIMDFRFYLTGAMEVKVISTGFIVASFYSSEEDPYGFRLHDTITGNIHHHLINFKVDLDINGTNNRFETLDIEQDVQDNQMSKTPNAKYYQTKFSHNIKNTETEAAYKFNFSAPKYLNILNEASKNQYGTPQAYRILNKGLTKLMLEEGENNEPAASWARYQMAVTKRKEEERFSSSFYSGYDANAPSPVVQFKNFLTDNENIIDEDLVAWVTMGMNHIPHQEDLPVLPTPGMDVAFFLLPFNYFPEDPAIASYNYVRIEPKDKSDKTKGILVDRRAGHDEVTCTVKESPFWAKITDDQTILFDTS